MQIHDQGAKHGRENLAYYQDADAYLLMYDVTNRITFTEELPRLCLEMSTKGFVDRPLYIVANKIDLP